MELAGRPGNNEGRPVILVDSSVWIAYFRGIATPRTARNFRTLRKLGVTVRKTIDTVIATRCIESGYTLLHDDRDFEPFVKYLGLREAA